MRPLLLLLTALILLPQAAQAGMITGNGTARVLQVTPDDETYDDTVSVVAAYSDRLGPKLGQRVIRLQFIRPDGEAVAYAVFSFYEPPLDGRIQIDSAGTSLLYYEVRPGNEAKVFLAGESAGEMTVYGAPNLSGPEPTATFKFTVRDGGADEVMGTEDDAVREIFAGDVVFFAHGDLSGLHYYYGESNEVVVGGDIFLVYDDGCTGSPDSYDDDYAYDSGDYDDSYSGDSCDGDVYDDDYDDSYSDDSYDDGSCDSDWDDDSDDWDSGDSDWDWSDSDSDWDWDGDTYDAQGRVMRGMNWLQRPPRWLVKELRRGQRLLPLLLAISLLLALRLVGHRRLRRGRQGGAVADGVGKD